MASLFMSRAFRLEAQVQSKLQQIERLRSIASKVTSNTANEPVSHTRDVTEMQDAVIRIMEEEEILKTRIKMLMDVKKQIRDVIEQVDDVTLQLILEKRYLLYESIKEIAAGKTASMTYLSRCIQSVTRRTLSTICVPTSSYH